MQAEIVQVAVGLQACMGLTHRHRAQKQPPTNTTPGAAQQQATVLVAGWLHVACWPP
jgi:hypothetical protein